MTPPENNLSELIDAYLDNRLTEADASSLRTAIATDPEAAQSFARAVYLEQHVATQFAPPATTEAGGASAPHAPPASPPAPEPTYPIYRKGHEPKPKSPFVPSSLRPFVPSLIAAALLAACGLAIYLLAFNADPSDIEHRPSNIEHPPLATLIESTPGSNLTTPGGFISEGRDYPRGEYALDKGTAEFMLTNSVNVKLRGQTRMSMHTDMSVSLAHGSAEFAVPPDATGFAVLLPDGTRVVDLGTRFTVRVDPNDRAEVRVLEGMVEVITKSASHRLSSGTRAVVERQVATVAAMETNDHVLVDWTFDELAVGTAPGARSLIEDRSIHGRAALLADTDAVPEAIDGPEAYGGGTALRFDGGDDGLVFDPGTETDATNANDANDETPGLRFGVNDSFTVEAIVRTTSSGTGAVVANDWDSRKPSWWLRIQQGHPRFFVCDGPIGADALSESRIHDGRWHHLAAVRHAEHRKLRLYVDHRLVAETDDATEGSIVNDQAISVGRYNNGLRQFVGDIDRVRITRGALEPARFIQPNTDARAADADANETTTPLLSPSRSDRGEPSR